MAADHLLPGRFLGQAGAPVEVSGFAGVQIDDDRLAAVLPPASRLLKLHEATIHAEAPVWQPAFHRLLWSDVPNRRLLAWYEDGHVEAALDPTPFINGNALMGDGGVAHCEHGRRCISRSAPDLTAPPEPLVTHFEGKRFNAPSDLAVAGDGSARSLVIRPADNTTSKPSMSVTTTRSRTAASSATPTMESPMVWSSTSAVGCGTSAADGVHVWSADRRKLGCIPLPAVVSNLTIGGAAGRRLFITATQFLFAIDLAA